VGRRILDPGDALIHPFSIAALALLLVNDHVLKSAAPGFVTGKLSDFAGLAFFPLLLLSAWEILLVSVGRWRAPSTRALQIAVGATAVGFISVKTLPAAAAVFAYLLSVSQWMLALPVHALAGESLGAATAVAVVVDASDLFALPALLVAVWVASSRTHAIPLRASIDAKSSVPS
jgi:hypothetical protein